ncbi:MAG: right-handed parallel beta-helix repeat-containing protein, partial [Anaerolineae bacterium]|nr:right-handed parallel beta-helix repeat-containing protein [Anaerolineae bacterium]
MNSITFNLRDYGAIGDGKALDSEAIKAAISACSMAGGGTVTVPSGQYLTSPFELLSNVTLYLDAGAVIQASSNLDDYPSEPEGSLVEWYRIGLVSAREAVNVAIEGYGQIDGSGLSFVYRDRFKYNDDQGSDFAKRYTRQGEDFLHDRWDRHESPYQSPPAQERPGNLIRFHKCQHVRLSNIVVANSPSWTILIDESQDVTITGLHIHSKTSDRRVPNDDGIDILHSCDVHISNCTIETGDDCIAIFAGQDITVSNCTLHSRSAGIRVGWMWGEIKNCTFQNLTIESNRGICVCVRGKYSIANIMFSHIIMRTQFKAGHWWGNGEPLHLSALPMYADQTDLGQIRNISFSHIIAESTNGIVAYGCEQSILKNISFEALQLT